MASSNGPYESDMENEERTRWDRARNSYRADDPQLSDDDVEEDDEEDDDLDSDDDDYCFYCGSSFCDGECEDEDEPDDDTEEEDDDDLES